MFVDLPQNLILMVVGAFLLGWLLSSVSSSFGSNPRARKRDPRDGRIRSLEAELRIAQTDAGNASEKVTVLEKELEEAQENIKKRDNVIAHQQGRLEGMSVDLKDSVKKTRELRNELSDRATENIRSEVKLREVATELEVAQASTDMIATGVLDYSLVPETDDSENDDDLLAESDMSEAAT